MKRSLLVSLGSVLVMGSVAPAQQKYNLFRMDIDDRAELVLEAMKDATTAVVRVNSKPMAQVAKAILESVDKRIQLYSERETERTPSERRWVAEHFIPRQQAQLAELEKAYDTVLARDVNLLPLFLEGATVKAYRARVEKRALLTTQDIYKASRAYYLSYQKWPATLEELITPSPKGATFLAGGKDAIQTPWGKPYQFKIEKAPGGLEVPVISAVSPFGDGKEEIRWPKQVK